MHQRPRTYCDTGPGNTYTDPSADGDIHAIADSNHHSDCNRDYSTDARADGYALSYRDANRDINSESDAQTRSTSTSRH